MHTDSVDTGSPPGQAALGSWSVYGGRITLDPVDRDTAVMWFTPTGADREDGEPFGDATFDAELDRFIVAWNSAGRMTLGRYQLDAIDAQIHHRMTRWRTR